MRFLPALVICFITPFVWAQPITNDAFTRVNSSYDELNPVLSADGKMLYFTMANHPENIGGKKDAGDIWISQWEGTQWSTPIHAGNTLNDRGYNAVGGISADGQNLYLLSHYDASGNSARTQGISISKYSGNGWGSPQNIVIPYFLNKSRILSGAMSAGNLVFIFSAETYGTHGVDDIYVSVLENGKWTEPKNLGPVINTQFQEVSPSLSEDGKTLYFSSNGRKGLGSFDIYTAQRLDDSWTNWSQPVNIGGSINSEGRDLYFRDFRQLGFSMYTTTKSSDGYGVIKIHRYNDPQPVVVKDTAVVMASADTNRVIEPLPQDPEQDPEWNKNVVKVYGTVKNSKTGEPVEAQIHFAGPAMENQTISTSADNGYMISIPSDQIYTIKIEAPGYISTLEKLDVHTYEMRELEMNFNLQPVEIGTTVNLKSVLFIQTKTDLLPESYDELDLVVSFLKTNPNVKIELSGHTDNRGVHGDNVRLSQQRVNAVKSYLVSKGIEPKRITGKGYGGTRPIASNETEETRKMNRRVEFTIKKF